MCSLLTSSSLLLLWNAMWGGSCLCYVQMVGCFRGLSFRRRQNHLVCYPSQSQAHGIINMRVEKLLCILNTDWCFIKVTPNNCWESRFIAYIILNMDAHCNIPEEKRKDKQRRKRISPSFLRRPLWSLNENARDHKKVTVQGNQMMGKLTNKERACVFS